MDIQAVKKIRKEVLNTLLNIYIPYILISVICAIIFQKNSYTFDFWFFGITLALAAIIYIGAPTFHKKYITWKENKQ